MEKELNKKLKTFTAEVETLINKLSLENDSNTPDFIIAEYLTDCLKTFNKTQKKRNDWYDKKNEFISESLKSRDVQNKIINQFK